MHTKVNYIAGFYVGENRSNPYYQAVFETNPLHFFDRHVEFLKTAKDIDLVTFVFNDDIAPELKECIDALSSTDIGKPLEIIYRKNSGFSYGIWNDVIENNLYDFDYFFLIEDDYIPSRPDFISIFRNKCIDDVSYVCSLAYEVSNKINHLVRPEDGSFWHPSISNGMITAESVRKVFNQHQRVFRIVNDTDYNSGYLNQLYYLKDYTDLGYKVIDTLDEYSSPYMNSGSVSVSVFGNPNNPPLLEPIT